MGVTAIVTVIVVAALVGIGFQYLLGGTESYEWLVVAIAGALGAFVASESIVGSGLFSGVTNWGPEMDGLFIVPGIIGGLLVALIADFGLRLAITPEAQTA